MALFNRYDLLPIELAGLLDSPLETNNPVSTSSVQVAIANTNRLSIAFSPGGSGAVIWVTTRPVAVNGQGWICVNANTPLLFRYEDYGPMIFNSWQAIASAVGQNLTVLDNTIAKTISRVVQNSEYISDYSERFNGKDKIHKRSIGSGSDYGYSPPFQQSPPNWIDDLRTANIPLFNRIKRKSGGIGPGSYILPAYSPSNPD